MTVLVPAKFCTLTAIYTDSVRLDANVVRLAGIASIFPCNARNPERVDHVPVERYENRSHDSRAANEKILSGSTDATKGSVSVLRLGPGLITAAADDDPSGIATYSQVGA